MSQGLWIQYGVIALLVLLSVFYIVRKLAPQMTTRWQAAVSIQLSKPGRAHWARRLGQRLQPKSATGHCGDGCSTCGSCGPAPARADTQPLVFKPRSH